ncbi:Undecaprenyl-phosphate glucose phosphotransferase [Caldicellulosiruptor hydrothermalis 108]|uniref:Undecaprenyl-phosphate glucose phosphotransferase n=1 Tax=Caldicellulosiruptor hydrothermalis (strain DSM 18901 / VKM B-2411 / 108) TaxID=632292 RepID=E4Q9C9_CALH1|nr:undecaprenyl-phosphate glucose phosphotransferase [Caldicellulosiruptor hydrothermalis]ADQ05800.1 Undecaprenyl-phosphate glucose phosphotransferase [Caldicellulosiruptor hydrothermalis 108]
MHNLGRLYIKIAKIIDIPAILLSFILSWFIKFNSGLFNKPASLDIQTYLLIVALHVPLYLFFLTVSGKEGKRSNFELFSDFIRILRSNIFALLIIVMIFYTLKLIDFSRIFLFIFVILNFLMSILQRLILRRILFSPNSKIISKERVLFVGQNEISERLSNIFERNNYQIIGFVVNESDPMNERVVGKIKDIESIVSNNHVDEIIIVLPLNQEKEINYIVDICEKYGIRTYLVPDYFKFIPSKAEIEKIEEIPLINIRYSPLDEWPNRFLKRTFDIVVSLLGLILCLPLFIIIAILIKLTSEGPIFFTQERVGYNRRIFKMHKFRTMFVQDPDEEKIRWTTKDDPRRTPIGKILRRLSLDELPQLWDVLVGNMSLVGPRPERPYFVEKFKEEIPKYMIKHRVRPGITGWAQIHGLRGDTSIEERIKYDIWYIENWSFWLDIKIILATIFGGKFMENAY